MIQSADELQFIVKNIIPGDFDHQLGLQKKLAFCRNLRTVVDTVRDLDIFIYSFLDGDLLRLSQSSLDQKSRIQTLRSALQGLAYMHDQGYVHNGKSRHRPGESLAILISFIDIKPNNILVDYDESTEGQFNIKRVQISDLEDAVLVPPGKWLRGPLCGNAMWRSPESWCRSHQNQASDIFSFGIVVRIPSLSFPLTLSPYRRSNNFYR